MIDRIKSFWDNRSGASTVEFVMIAPLFLGAVFSTFEEGWLMTKSMMLERAVDLTTREIRFGTGSTLTHDAFKDVICGHASLIKDCTGSMTLEMTTVNPALGGTDISPDPVCQEQAVFVPPGDAAFVFIRACVVVKPLFPFIGLALHLPKHESGERVLIAYSSFVTEPDILPVAPVAGL